MCFERNVIDHKRVVVHIERFHSWIIKTPNDSDGAELLNSMFNVTGQESGVDFVRAIEPYRQRKSRLVNGSHFALALKMGCQREGHYLTTDQFMRECAGIHEMIERIHAAYIESLLVDFSSEFTRDELVDYSNLVQDRLVSEPDTPARIMKRLTRDDLEEWISSYYLRVHQPLTRYDRELAKNLAENLYQILDERDLGRDLFFNVLEGMEAEKNEEPDF